MPLEDLTSGTEGRAKTVFSGTEVEDFPVEIIDIIENEMNNNLILIKARGEKIDEVGGIAAGMSGSPVYVDNKLIGAIAYGWEDVKDNYAMVTPINRMLDLLENDNMQSSKANKMINETDEPPLNTPLVINGLEGRALERVKKELTSSDPEVLPGSKLKKEVDSYNLEPGSAVAVQLVRGDIDVASLGTLTYIDNNKILAFGHPFTNKGSVNFLLSGAYINSIISSENQPFKLGTPFKELLGIIKADRGAGIAGILKQYPYIVPLTVKVKDEDRGTETTTRVQLIKDDSLLPALGNNIALQAVDNTIDRIGRGTAKSRIKIMGKEIPDLTLEKQNLFYSTEDIAMTALTDFTQVLNIFSSNPFKNAEILDIVFELEISSQDKTALIQEAKVLNDSVSPGDTLDIELTLHPYRKDEFSKIISVDLPEDMNQGMANIVITGGFINSYNEVPQDHESEDYEIKQNQITGYKDFESIIEDYLDTPKNNELIIQVYPGQDFAGDESEVYENSPETEEPDYNEGKENGNIEDQEPSDEEQPDFVPPAPDREDTDSEKIQKTVKTEYVLEGDLNLQVKVENGNTGNSSDKGIEEEDDD
ncbi:MAG: SpoIVB peptidase S55 domain-containing protein [Halanaerobiaceae bacterium]